MTETPNPNAGQNPNGCSEPIGSTLRRYGVPEQLVHDIERDYRDLARLMQREVPRTITLAYTPRAADDDERAGDDDFDAGGHWTIYEQGNASPPLDQQEALALIAAMLLGAKHPPLRSLFGTWRATARANRRVREAREERDRIDGERMDLAHALGAARDRLHSLPWELAHVLCAELRRGSPLPTKPEDIREVFALPLLELAHRMGMTPAREPTVAAESKKPAPETYRGAPLVEAVAEADRAIVEAMAAEAEREEAPQEDADAAELQRAIDAELEDLADMLDAAGRARSVHELREWPDDWRIDAQNWAFAMRAWMESSAGNEEPAAPWFLTGEPEPLESIEVRAGEEHAGFGLEPIGGDELPSDPVPGVLSQVIAGGSTSAVPPGAVSGIPGDFE